MQIGSLAFDPGFLLDSLKKANRVETPLFSDAQLLPAFDPASLASSNTIMPTQPAAQLDAGMLMMLQGEPQSGATEELKPSATDAFLEEMKKSPMERLREQILDSLGLTEDDLESMPPEMAKAVEKKIAELMQEKIREAAGVDSSEPSALQSIDLTA